MFCCTVHVVYIWFKHFVSFQRLASNHTHSVNAMSLGCLRIISLTSSGGKSPYSLARSHLCSLVIPIHGPNSESKSNSFSIKSSFARSDVTSLATAVSASFWIGSESFVCGCFLFTGLSFLVIGYTSVPEAKYG